MFGSKARRQNIALRGELASCAGSFLAQAYNLNYMAHQGDDYVVDPEGCKVMAKIYEERGLCLAQMVGLGDSDIIELMRFDPSSQEEPTND